VRHQSCFRRRAKQSQSSSRHSVADGNGGRNQAANPTSVRLCRDQAKGGTDRELSANFDQESSATRVERDVSGDVGAYFNVARHAVKCAEQRRTQDGA